MSTNERVVLASRPTGPATSEHFRLESEPLPELEPGQVRVAVEYLSIDAAIRTMLRGEGFHTQIAPGEVIRAGGVGRVVETADDSLAVGDAVRGQMGAQTMLTTKAKRMEKLENPVTPLSAYLGALGGSTGVTAWIGVREVGKPQPGEIFVVSAAAGAVGSVAGQIAKIDGATVIGIAGGPEKCAHLIANLGFDHAIDYKNEDVNARLKAIAPDGISVFYDNVGGPILDDVLDNLALRARVVICGAISQYDDMDNVTGPSLYLRLAERQSRMEGFAYFHYLDSIPTAMGELAGWLGDGSLLMPEEILEGIESFPEAVQFMFQGGNTGKLMVKI